MKGDFSRSTFDQKKHYTGVLMQQGRVQLDSDHNEQVEINSYQRDVRSIDIIGACGVPKGKAGFLIVTDPQGLPEKEREDYENSGLSPLKSNDFLISRGRCYVDGILCENEETTRYLDQKDLPEIIDENEISAEGVYLAYLDVWKEHVTSLEDPEIRETALGGPDTATRSKTVWQVKARHLKKNPDLSDGLCIEKIPEWSEICSRIPGRIAAKPRDGESGDSGYLDGGAANADTGDGSDRNCKLQSQGGYGRLENQLYRIEVHNGNEKLGAAPTFKWSRDNGSVAMVIRSIKGLTVEVTHTGRDSILGLSAGQWIEILDDRNELLQKPGQLRKIVRVEDDGCSIVLDKSPSPLDASKPAGVNADYHPRLRRWDTAGEGATENGATITYDWQELEGEGGILIKFSKDGSFRTQDYWTIPARAAFGSDTGKIEWPLGTGNTPLEQPPKGVIHHYCCLALLSYQSGILSVIQGTDCRKLFAPLTSISASDVSFDSSNCPAAGGATVQDALDALCKERRQGCAATVGKGLGQFDYLDDALGKLLLKSNDLHICLLPGDHSLSRGLTVSSKQPANIKIFGSGPGTRIKLDGPWAMKNLAYVSLKDISILAGEMDEHAMTFEDCSEVCLEGCRISGVSSPIDLQVKPGATVDKLSVKSIADGKIVLDNQTSPITPGKNSSIKLIGNIWIRTSSASSSRYYLYKKVAKTGNYYDIRGEMATGSHTWNPQNFPGLYYDINGDIGKEKLIIKMSSGKVLEDPDGVRYETTAQPKKFSFQKWGSYSFMPFLGDEYCAAYILDGKLPAEDQIFANKSPIWNFLARGAIRKILMDDISQRTVVSGASISLKNGYSLTVTTIDLAGNKVYLNLYKEGQSVNSKVISPSKDGATMTDKTYVYRESSRLSANQIVSFVKIAVHFDRIFSNADKAYALVDAVWQISDDPMSIKVDMEYDKMRIKSVDASKGKIEMDIKDNRITLSKNKEISLAGSFKLKTANSDVLRYCPVQSAIGEDLEVRGQVASGDFTWQTKNFSGLFYDLDNDLGNETIKTKLTDKSDLVVTYETSAKSKQFAFRGWGSFMSIGFSGEEYFAGYVKDANLSEADQIPYQTSKDKDVLSKGQLFKVLMNQGTERTITAGSQLTMEEGYSLSIKAIDIDGSKVYLELAKGGMVVGSGIVSPSKDGATMAEKTFVYKRDIGACKDLASIAVHFKNAFRGADTNIATVDGIWQISETFIDVHEPEKIKGESALLNIANAKSILLSDSVLQAYSKTGLAVNDEILQAIPELGQLSKSIDKSSYVWRARNIATALAADEEEFMVASKFSASNLLAAEAVSLNSAVAESAISENIRSSPVNEPVSAAASVDRSSNALVSSKPMIASMMASTRDLSLRTSSTIDLKASFAKSKSKLSMAECNVYESLIYELDKTGMVSAERVLDNLIGIYDTVLRQKPGTALIISDGKGDVVLSDNDITGLISLYGPALGANVFSDDELKTIKECLAGSILSLGNLSGALRLRGNRLTRMNVGEILFLEMKDILDNYKNEKSQKKAITKHDLDEIFHLISLTDNLFEQGLNMWIGREIRLTGNAFDQPGDQKNGGIAIDGHAMFIGNSVLDIQKESKVAILNCSARTSEKSANADLEISDL